MSFAGRLCPFIGGPYPEVEKTFFASFIGNFCPYLVQIRTSDVDMIKNNSGRASGIAYVNFANREIAEMAIREKDGKHIGSRYLELSMNY